jgi:predicted dehydrogenase
LVSDIVVMDINPARAEAFKKRSKVSKVTTDLSEVMNDRDIPLVFVTASNDAHKPLCMAAFEAGKAVMCEKPMANTLADAKEMVEAAERKGLFF